MSVKQTGQVFTPHYLVCNILDTAGYLGKSILQKHTIDNSCGNGAFLSEIASRYCEEFLSGNADKELLKMELQSYIHGIEIDEVALKSCMFNLDNVAYKYGITNVDWDIVNDDALKVSKFNGKMDYVIGNPPYVRVHNLENQYDEVKKYKFAGSGMTDLFLVFFEIGLNMLNAGGKLCYITPSSWLSSVAGEQLRHYIFFNRNLLELIDLEHYQAFEGATTYTLISLFEKGVKNDEFIYSHYNESLRQKEEIARLKFEEAFIDNCIYLADKRALQMLKDIKKGVIGKYASVKNGFATLADNVFIKDDFPFEQFIIPVIKASTGKWLKAFYPYDKQGKPYSRNKIFANKEVEDYLNENKIALLKRKSEKSNPEWYLYGRTQALKDVCTDKYSINTCIKDINSIKLNKVPAGCGLYSGLYIITNIQEHILRSIIECEDFIEYVSMLKKYKSGGYYTFSSKDLELYINYKIEQIKNDGNKTNESGILDGNFTIIW